MSNLVHVRTMTGQLLEASSVRARAVSQGQRPPPIDDRLAEQRLAAVQAGLAALPEVTQAVRDLFTSAAETYRAVRELETALEQYRIAHQTSLERARIAAPIVQQQLTRLSDRIDRVLDRVLEMDASSCAQPDLAHRTSLLQLVDSLSAQLSGNLLAFLRV